MKTVTIIAPVYNEEAVLPAFHANLSHVLKTLEAHYSFEILYVLDRCSDNSFAVLTELAKGDARVTVLHLSRRFGHQMSLVAGLDYSSGDAVVMMDCDLQHPPEVIPDLLGAFESGYDVVHAIRRYTRSTSGFRRITSALFYKLQNSLSPVAIEEGSADFRLISRRVAEVFRGSIREQNQFLRGLFRWVGYPSANVFFECRSRATGTTKYHLRRLLAFSIQGITSFSKVPLRIASVAGLLLSCASMLYGAWSAAGYFMTRQLPPGYTTLIVAVLFVGGLQLLVLGILGEYVGSIFDEVKCRPLYLVDEVVGAAARDGRCVDAAASDRNASLMARSSR